MAFHNCAAGCRGTLSCTGKLYEVHHVFLSIVDAVCAFCFENCAVRRFVPFVNSHNTQAVYGDGVNSCVMQLCSVMQSNAVSWLGMARLCPRCMIDHARCVSCVSVIFYVHFWCCARHGMMRQRNPKRFLYGCSLSFLFWVNECHIVGLEKTTKVIPR